jgi:hypothetical protein
VYEGPVSDDGEEQRAARCTARVVQLVVAVDEKVVGALDQLELLALDAGCRLEGGPGRRAAT